jgi:MarR family transcriptional regulator, organic hydroperoxide resistance regulator
MIDQNVVTLSAERAGQLLRELTGIIIQRSAGEMMRTMSRSGLSMPQIVALHLLRKCGTLSISAIAEKLELSLAATSHLVDRMVQQNLVLRIEDPADRRQKRVTIAADGLEVLDQLVQARMREAGQVIAALPPELSSQFEQVLEQVLVQLRAADSHV